MMTDIDAETQALQDWGEEGRATQRAIDDALATTRAELAAKDAEIARLQEQLADPNAVHVNLLRGSIARPTVHQMIHIYSPAKVRDGLETYARARLAGDTA